jgi:hypothetical protein
VICFISINNIRCFLKIILEHFRNQKMHPSYCLLIFVLAVGCFGKDRLADLKEGNQHVIFDEN